MTKFINQNMKCERFKTLPEPLFVFSQTVADFTDTDD